MYIYYCWLCALSEAHVQSLYYVIQSITTVILCIQNCCSLGIDIKEKDNNNPIMFNRLKSPVIRKLQFGRSVIDFSLAPDGWYIIAQLYKKSLQPCVLSEAI